MSFKTTVQRLSQASSALVDFVVVAQTQAPKINLLYEHKTFTASPCLRAQSPNLRIQKFYPHHLNFTNPKLLANLDTQNLQSYICVMVMLLSDKGLIALSSNLVINNQWGRLLRQPAFINKRFWVFSKFVPLVIPFLCMDWEWGMINGQHRNTPPTGPTEVHHGGYEDSRYTFTQVRLTVVAALPQFRDTY